MNIRTFRWVAATIAFCAAGAQAAFHTFVIDQVFSNADGTVQYVVMRESTGSNNEHLWSGNSFATTNAAGMTKQIAFSSNLPSSSTAGRSVLIATPGFAALGLVTPDYMIQARFVPTDGGNLNYGGIDQITLPRPLPTDGVTAINRNGNPVAATPRNFANATATMTATPVGNVEFYNQSLDHYFISALAPDIDALDSGRFVGWMRTGGGFMVYPSQAAGGAGANPVCRIRIPPVLGDSHFYSASPQECAASLANTPALVLESSNVFYIALPAAGACPNGTIPAYRVWNQRLDSNHRYTTDRMVRDQMVARGWLAEGDGPDIVVMCALPGAVSVNGAAPPGGPMPPPPPYLP